MTKRRIWLLVICGLIVLSTVFFTIYDNVKAKNNPNSVEDDAPLKVVCTIFPEYDWAKNIIGEQAIDQVELSMIVKNGVDLHSFQPSTADILEISTADVFIYVGGVSDNWVTDVLKNVKNKDMIVVNLMDVLGDRVVVKETVEGMEAHQHDHEELETDFSNIEFKDTHNEVVYDEHVWLSLENAKVCCTAIAKELALARPKLGHVFSKNCSNYIYNMTTMSNDFAKEVENFSSKTLIFCDRFPFRYLLEDYGLEYYAAFSGCSAESEASFETIAFLSHKVQELNARAVCVIDNSDKKIARTVISNANRPDTKIATLDSMQSTTLDDAKNGKTYLDTMYRNLRSIQAVLK